MSEIILFKNNAENYKKVAEIEGSFKSFHSLREEVKNEKIKIKSPLGYDLVGYYFPTEEKSNKTIVTVHGKGGSKESMLNYIKMFHSLGFNVIAYDQRNHGESGGDYTTYGIIESRDLKTVVEYAKKHSNNGQVGVHGVSMGASTTLMYAGENKDAVSFYIIDCAYSDFTEETKYQFEESYSFIPKMFVEPIIFFGDLFLKVRGDYSIKEIKPIDDVGNIEEPVLFINTKMDTLIPPHMTEDLYKKKKEPKSIYWTKTGKHAEAYQVDPLQYRTKIVEFLKVNKLE